MAGLARYALLALAALPLRAIRLLGASLAALALLLPLREHRVTAVNLKIAFPELGERARRRLARRSLLETGRTFAELAAVWNWSRERIERHVRGVSGEELVREAIAAGRGVILAVPHLGAWELLGIFCSARYPMTSLYRPPRLREMEAFVKAARERNGARLVPAGSRAVRSMVRALRRGELVAILPDQDAGEGLGIFVPFFGEQANTMVLLPRLAARTDALVVLGFAERLRGGAGWHVHFVPASSEIHDPDLERSATAMNRDIERLVHRRPDQYLWSYKRFRIRFDGPDLYR